MTGKIMKGIGGFYYVYVEGCGLYECRAKGIFRNKKMKTNVGDIVEIDVLSEEAKTGNLTKIHPRKNQLIRPMVANVDQALVIFAVHEPEPNFHLLNRFLVMMECQQIPVTICFNKMDLATDEEREKLIDNGEYLPSYMWNTNGWLCDKLGLTVVSQRQKCIPMTSEEDIESTTLNMTVKKGEATGMSAVVTTETKEGITIESECIGKVYGKEDCDRNDWTVYGEPDTNLVITRPSTVELTCSAIVNRIKDVICAEDGFVPTSRMGELKYTQIKK